MTKVVAVSMNCGASINLRIGDKQGENPGEWRMLPKETGFTAITDAVVETVAATLNARLRKVLVYRIPAEAFAQAQGPSISGTAV